MLTYTNVVLTEAAVEDPRVPPRPKKFRWAAASMQRCHNASGSAAVVEAMQCSCSTDPDALLQYVCVQKVTHKIKNKIH